MAEEQVDPDSSDGEPHDPLVGGTLADRYDVVEVLGDGGMGRVYRGVQKTLERPVAIKCLHSHLASAEEVVGRFMSEARIASQLNHPNIVRIFDFGIANTPNGEQMFIVMEMLEGKDLGSILEADGPFSAARLTDVLKQVLAGLGEAHANDVVHRDIKPENVIIEKTSRGRDRVKVIDFGIARVQGAVRQTQANQLIGTPYYMSPEMVRGQDSGAQSDLYAVGAMMFELLTGTPLFNRDTLVEVLQAQMSED